MICLIWVWYLIWLIPLVLIVFVDCWTAVFPHILPGMNSELHNVPPSYCTLVNKDRCGKATISWSFFLEKPWFFPHVWYVWYVSPRVVGSTCQAWGSTRATPTAAHGRGRRAALCEAWYHAPWGENRPVFGDAKRHFWVSDLFFGLIRLIWLCPLVFRKFVWDDSYIGWGVANQYWNWGVDAACGRRIPRFQ